MSIRNIVHISMSVSSSSSSGFFNPILPLICSNTYQHPKIPGLEYNSKLNCFTKDEKKTTGLTKVLKSIFYPHFDYNAVMEYHKDKLPTIEKKSSFSSFVGKRKSSSRQSLAIRRGTALGRNLEIALSLKKRNLLSSDIFQLDRDSEPGKRFSKKKINSLLPRYPNKVKDRTELRRLLNLNCPYFRMYWKRLNDEFTQLRPIEIELPVCLELNYSNLKTLSTGIDVVCLNSKNQHVPNELKTTKLSLDHLKASLPGDFIQIPPFQGQPNCILTHYFIQTFYDGLLYRSEFGKILEGEKITNPVLCIIRPTQTHFFSLNECIPFTTETQQQAIQALKLYKPPSSTRSSSSSSSRKRRKGL